MLLTNNSTSTTITDFDDATTGIEFTLIIGDNNTTIEDNSNIHLKGNRDFVANQMDNITFIYSSTGWHEISRSNNSSYINEWTEVYGNYTAQPGDKLMLDSTSTFNITLPPNPKFGYEVDFCDGAGECESNNVTVLRNGEKIMGLNEDMNININYASFKLVYFNSTNGWRIVFQQ